MRGGTDDRPSIGGRSLRAGGKGGGDALDRDGRDRRRTDRDRAGRATALGDAFSSGGAVFIVEQVEQRVGSRELW